MSASKYCGTGTRFSSRIKCLYGAGQAVYQNNLVVDPGNTIGYKARMIKEKTISTIKMLDQIMEVLEPEMYSSRLGSLRSNTIGEQLWCLAGARESYLSAVKLDSEFNWICSFGSDANSKPEIDQYIKECTEKFISFLKNSENFTKNQQSLLLDFIGHEFQHQGQLIRYLYGNKFPVPNGWREYWHLEQ